MAKTDKKKEIAKIQIEKTQQIEQESNQILKEQSVEDIPNVHLAQEQLNEVNLHSTLSQQKLVLTPIFVAPDSDIQAKTIFDEIRESFPANVEGSEEFNEANKIKKSPMAELIDFINANAKDFLIEKNLLISLIKKTGELKEKEKELMTEWISKSYLLGYSDCETEKQQEIPNFYKENFGE